MILIITSLKKIIITTVPRITMKITTILTTIGVMIMNYNQ